MFGGGELRREVAAMSDAELADHVAALGALADEVEAARLAAVGEWDARAVWALDGAPNGAVALAAHGRLARSTAGGIVRAARRLRAMPVTAAALEEGRLVPAKARLLANAINPRTEEAFARDEALLVEQAASLTVDQTATMVRFWLLRADVDGAGGHDHDHDVAHLSQTWQGRWRLDANLDAECGAIVDSVLGTIAEELREAATGEAPAMTGATLRAWALVEMARRATAAPGRPAQRPLLWVTVDLQALRERAGAASVGASGAITAQAARRLACDAGVARLLMDGPSAVVDLGTTVRTATPTQHRMLALRDRGCVFPGCDRPPGWCQAHHIVHWIDHGPTDLDNLCLLCSHHHHLVHEGGYGLKRAGDGELVFTRPDGSRVDPPVIAA
jgi:hypothetical protein